MVCGVTLHKLCLQWQVMAEAFYSSKVGRAALEAAKAPYQGTKRQTDSLATTQFGPAVCAAVLSVTCMLSILLC